MFLIQALFASSIGEGTRCTFITSLRKEKDVEEANRLDGKTIGNSTFFIGVTMSEVEYPDMDNVAWHLNGLGGVVIQCTSFPYFK